jgi:thiol-disulfide isomerase/thioredoxin
MESIQSSSYSLLSSSKFWMILVAILLFLFVAVFVYNKYVAGVLSPNYIANNEFPSEMTEGESGDGEGTSEDSGPEVEIIMFTVEWCPHSKKAMPVWEELKEKYNGKRFNGHKLTFVEVNGEENPGMADKYKVEGYPTIKMLKDNQVIEYDAKPSVAHLTEFLNSTLG